MAYSSLVYENDKLFSAVDIPYTALNLDPKFERIYKGSITPANLLTLGVDYTKGFQAYDVLIVIPTQRLKAGEVYIVENYSDNTFSTIVDTTTVNILPRFAYVSTSAPVSNTITLSETTDKSSVMATPIDVPKCTTFPINGYYLNKLSHRRDSDAINIPNSGLFEINGVALTTSNIVLENPIGNTASAGVVDYEGSGKHAQITTAILPSNNISYKYTHNGIDTKSDFSFDINGIGFTKIGSDGNTSMAGLLHRPSSPQQTLTNTPNSVYEIILTPTQYILKIDNVTVDTVNRNISYSSENGNLITPTGNLTYGTQGFFNAVNLGEDCITVTFDVVDGITGSGNKVCQEINVIDTPAPIFSEGTSYSNICPSNTFDLASLVTNNSRIGHTLKFYSNVALTTEITNLILSSTQTVYASFESDDSYICNSLFTTLNIIITTCVTTTIPVTGNAINHSYTVAANNTVIGNVSTGNTSCSSGTTTYRIKNNNSNTLPFNTGSGTIVLFNQTTGAYVYNQTNTLAYGVNFDGFDYELLCAGILTDTGRENFSKIESLGTAINHNYTTTSNVIVGSVNTGSVGCSNSGTKTFKLIGYTGSYSPFTSLVLPNGVITNFSETSGTYVFTKNTDFFGIETVDFEMLCNNTLVDVKRETFVFIQSKTAVPTIETTCIEKCNSVIIGKSEPNALINLYNENTALLYSTTADSTGKFVINMETWYNLGMAFLIKAKVPNGEISEYTPFILKCNMRCEVPVKRKCK